MIFTSTDEATACMKEWQEILRLQDWDIKIDILRARDMKLDEGQAEVHWRIESKSALIYLLDPLDYKNDYFEQDHERSMVHELLHLHMALFSADTGTPEDIAQEQAINTIANSLVGLKYKGGDV